MTASKLPTVAVSAPGKVLLAGGYLILDREFTGLVLGLDARIHVHIRPLVTSSGVSLEEIIVRSPQFREAVWNYGYRLTEKGGGISAFQLRSSAREQLKPNPFIETTLTYVLSYVTTVTGSRISPASITILADDSYYTTPPTSSITQGSSGFRDFGVKLSDAHKTGLGSSAALITSLTAALLSRYLPSSAFSLDSDKGRVVLHNLAQTAHCVAQGKVGSGFDVAAAVYGPCIYKRFSPSLISDLGRANLPNFALKLKTLVEDEAGAWDTQIQLDAVRMPKGLRLLMCDVDAGSQTPGMVREVLSWRSREPDEAGMLWTSLQERNMALADSLKELSETGSQDYSALKRRVQEIRALIRDMSRLSSVPIEPESQTELLDALSAIDGVLGGVVPGAGGFDAIALLLRDDGETMGRVQQRLDQWNYEQKAKADSTMNSIAGTNVQLAMGDVKGQGKVSTLPVKQSHEGTRYEHVGRFEGWLQ